MVIMVTCSVLAILTILLSDIDKNHNKMCLLQTASTEPAQSILHSLHLLQVISLALITTLGGSVKKKKKK